MGSEMCIRDSNTARDHVANARTVLTVDAYSVNPGQNLNKYIYKTI